MSIVPANRGMLDFMAKATGLSTTGDFTGIAAVDGEILLAMVGFDKWTHNAVRIHIFVMPGVIPPRSLVTEALGHAFASKGVLVAEIAKSNAPSLRMAHFFGFRPVGNIKDGWKEGDDLIILQLRREWLERKVA